MACNVYRNIEALGCNVVLKTNKNCNKITKTRYVDLRSNHMFMRVDENDNLYGRCNNLDKINFSDYSAIIVSDYNKGFLTIDDIKYISMKHDSVFLDSKRILGDWCENIKFVKINSSEYENTKHTVCSSLEEKLIVTLGPYGSRLGKKVFSVNKVEVKDVSGAGDTFISALVVNYAKTKDINKAINFANKCSTIVVQKQGISTI